MLDIFGIDTQQNVMDTLVHMENISLQNLGFVYGYHLQFQIPASSNEMCLTNIQQKTLVSSIAVATMN
jgi:hypothetical protein